CGSGQSTRPTISRDLMSPPCKASDAGRDSDEDLQADTQTTECVRELRTNIYRWQSWYRATE
ncbi:hypothetical protein ACNGWO_003891, partial [Salmonella enterica]